MRKSLRAILQSSGLNLVNKVGLVRVQLELRTTQLDAFSRNTLQVCGLSIDQVVGNKVFGTIDAQRRSDLAQLDFIASIEDAVPLHPHRHDQRDPSPPANPPE